MNKIYNDSDIISCRYCNTKMRYDEAIQVGEFFICPPCSDKSQEEEDLE